MHLTRIHRALSGALVAGLSIALIAPMSGAATAAVRNAPTVTSTSAADASAVPVIDSFTPSTGPVGTQVTLTGSGFTGTTAVLLGTTAAPFTVDSDTSLSVTVPEGATSGQFNVTTPEGEATSAGTFTVDDPPPTVSGFTFSQPSGDQTVFLKWSNPPIGDLKEIRIRRTTGATSTAPGHAGGTAAYTGTGTSAKVTGLTNGTTYRFWAYVSDTAGQWSGPGGPVTAKPVAPKLTSLSLSRSTSTLTYGSSVRLTAKLTTGSTSVSGEKITFYGRRKGTSTWTALTTGTTVSGGTISTVRTPGSHYEYRATHARTLYYASSTSPTVTVLVKPALTASISPSSALNGTTVRITGTLKPAHGGQSVYLQRLTSDGWRSVLRSTLSSGGGYSFSTRPTTSGSYSYRVYKPADGDHLAAYSGKLTYRAYRVVISGIHYDAAGDDRNNESDEYAVLKNTGRITVNLRGWRLWAGDAGQNYTLPSYSLAPGASVRVITGCGGSGIKLCLSSPIWNNDGETGRLYDPRGKLSSSYTYN